MLDRERLNNLYGDDHEFKVMAFHTFLQDVESNISTLQAYYQQKELQALGRLAHKMKPSFGMVGLSKGEQLLRQVEASIKENNFNSEAEGALFQFFKIAPECLLAIRSEINTSPS